MHLVFVTSLVPDGAPSTGYEIANAAVIDALRRAGAKVTVLGFTWPGKMPAEPHATVVLGSVDVRTDTASALQKFTWAAEAVRQGLTISSVKLTSVSQDRVRAALAGIGPFDAYVLNSVQLAGAFPRLFADRPSIYVAHNVEFRSAAENAVAARDPLQRLLYRREARLLEALERRLCARARFVFTLAEEDRAALGIADERRSAALPLVTRAAPTPPGPRQTSCDAALLGTWTWRPNGIGLEWFLGEVVPHLPHDFRIEIGGRTPPQMASSHPGLRFAGRVEDATSFVRSGAVVPLVSRAGTGVQLKTIEAFELGLPSVATSNAVRGIGTIPENCTVTDDPAEFAAALVKTAHGDGRDLDGRAFHAAQLRLLDARVARGLDALALAQGRAAA